MRKVFSSPRLENVEAVANLLREQGIAVKIDQGRSYHGNRRRTFSYRVQEDEIPQASVWIVHADDQPRGRQLLRDAGLLESSRAGEGSYLPVSVLEQDGLATVAKAGRVAWFKAGLLVLITFGIGLVYFSTRKPAPVPAPALAAAAPAPPPIVPQLAGDLVMYRANVPTALATLLLEREIGSRTPAQACIAIDGKDPAAAFIEALDAGSTQVFAASACPPSPALAVAIDEYMTDGSGAGRVQLGVDGKDARSVEVERDGTRWRILRVR